MQEEERAARQQHKEETRKRREPADQKRKDLDKEAKAKLKAEKLRKQYEKAQKRVAELEAKKSTPEEKPLLTQEEPHPSQDHLNTLEKKDVVEPRVSREDGLPMQSEDRTLVNDKAGAQRLPNESQDEPKCLRSSELPEARKTEPGNKSEMRESPIHGADPLTPTSQPLSLHSSPRPSTFPAHQASPLPVAAAIPTSQLPDVVHLNALGGPQEVSNLNSSGLDSGTDDSEFYTSSDLSSSEDNDKDSSSSGTSSSSGAPTSEPFQRTTGPEQVSAPNPVKKRAICKDFLRNGRCKRGAQCYFRHELPERGKGVKSGRKQTEKRAEGEEKKGRMSLYQRVSCPYPLESEVADISDADGGAGAGKRGRSDRAAHHLPWRARCS